MREIVSPDLGRITVREIPIPAGIIPDQAIYTYTGRVAVPYRVPGEDEDRLHIATVNDDGSDWHEIFDGPVKLLPKGNGLRFMPFPDNKRALLGDYVFECAPDMNSADPANSRVVLIHYPEALTAMPYLWKVWSEIIIAPDNEHMAWNGLGALAGAYIGKLRREEDGYHLDDVRTISTGKTVPDPDHPGCVILAPTRGGEIKQFIRGGRSISFVGADRGAGDSMVQALDSEDVYSVTRTPGYDETTIFSPDHRLGIVMSTRFSPRTSAAYMGMIPRRGNMAVKGNVIQVVYQYGVTAVREGKEGNIGPALIDIEKSMTVPGYLGVNLSDPTGEWAYYSPMSWHPDGKKAMWNEGQKRDRGHAHRVMIAVLEDHFPGDAFPAQPVPEHISYALPGVDHEGGMMRPIPDGLKVAGQVSGYATTTVTPGQPAKYTVTYEQFSDDGKSFLNGWESVVSPGLIGAGDTVYDAKMTMTGENTGEMDIHVVYHRPAMEGAVEITPDSHGFARYNNETVYL